ncbi:MAG: hypothetical protein MJ244_01590 [Clostridia bacterium]|nr:hypothetical protein [Clostridia bacterium]
MKKLFVTLITVAATLSLVACGNANQKAEAVTDPAPAVEVEAPAVEVEVEEPEVEVTVEEPEVVVEVEEPVVEEVKTFAEENNIEVVEIADVFQHDYSFIEYNKDGDVVLDADAQRFNCPTTVTKNETDNGDGTKTVIYTAVFDIRDWSLEFNYYSSDTFFCDIYSGKTIKRDQTSLIFNDEEIAINYAFEDAYDENYTTHTKNYKFTCPVEYDGYALFLGDAAVINASNSCDDIADILLTGEADNRMFVR